jgi:hypothetical protein
VFMFVVVCDCVMDRNAFSGKSVVTGYPSSCLLSPFKFHTFSSCYEYAIEYLR